VIERQWPILPHIPIPSYIHIHFVEIDQSVTAFWLLTDKLKITIRAGSCALEGEAFSFISMVGDLCFDCWVSKYYDWFFILKKSLHSLLPFFNLSSPMCLHCLQTRADTGQILFFLFSKILLSFCLKFHTLIR
jgi:hypothetical protein